MGKSFVYNTGSSEDHIPPGEFHLNFGIFIDGTLNNMYNTDYRTEYARGGLANPDWKLTNSQIEASDEEKYTELKEGSKDKLTPKSKYIDRIEELLAVENRDHYQQEELESYPKAEVYLAASRRKWLDKMGTDNSFSNDHSNVARMWTCCNEDYKIYIEGMGTIKLDKDDEDGFAFGAGSKSGIRARVREGCEKLADKISEQNKNEINKTKKLTQITLDVFGFSRGAASARNFLAEVNYNEGIYLITNVQKYEYKAPEDYSYNAVKVKDNIPTQHSIDNKSMVFSANAIKKEAIHKKEIRYIYKDRDGQIVNPLYVVNGKMPKFGHLGISLLKKGIVKKPEDLNKITLFVRFLGIYDTVSSYGEIGEMGGDFVKGKGVIHLANSFFKDDEEELNLQNMGEVQQIVHFSAKDEHRENFALTRVDKKYDKKNDDGSDRLIEKNFPGVHCDIGGAYMSEPEVIDEIETTAFLTPKTAFTASGELENIKEYLINNYWFTDKQIQITKTAWHYPLKVVELFLRMNFFFKTAYALKQANYEALTSHRDMRKEYSYIPLHFMEDYFRPFVKLDHMPNSTIFNYSISNLPVLVQAKAYLKQHVLKDNKEWVFAYDAEVLAMKKMKDAQFYERHETTKDNIPSTQPKLDYEKDQAYAKAHQRATEESRKEYLETRAMVNEEGKYVSPANKTKAPPVYAWEKDYPPKELNKVEAEPEINYEAQALLRILRNQYFHWSSNRDWLGMDQSDSRIRVEYPKK